MPRASNVVPFPRKPATSLPLADLDVARLRTLDAASSGALLRAMIRCKNDRLVPYVSARVLGGRATVLVHATNKRGELAETWTFTAAPGTAAHRIAIEIALVASLHEAPTERAAVAR